METREELLSGLNEAEIIIKKLAGIQQQLDQIRTQYMNPVPNKKMGILVKIVLGIFFWVIVYFISQGEFGSAITAILETAVIYYVAKFYYKRKNQRIDSQNEQIEISNARNKINEQAVFNELREVQITYAQRISSWYPEDYCSVDAVEFLHSAVKNQRADSMKEAINLYENVLHQRRVEDNQQEALKQQKLNNLLAVGNIAMQGATLSAIKNQGAEINNTLNNELGRQTRALEKTSDAVEAIKKKITTPKWLR